MHPEIFSYFLILLSFRVLRAKEMNVSHFVGTSS